MEQICLNINKKNYNVAIEKNWTLLYVLREELELTAVKCRLQYRGLRCLQGNY